MLLFQLPALPTVTASPSYHVIDEANPTSCSVTLSADQGWTVSRVVPTYVGHVCEDGRWGDNDVQDAGQTVVLIVELTKEGELSVLRPVEIEVRASN